jgi:glutamyl-tRNA reductase
VIDLGVPRNVDAQVNGLDNVFLYDVDDLQDVTAANVEQRRRESERAERIVEQEQERFEGWLVALQAVPTIRDLRSFADSVRRRELERQLGRLGLDDAQAEGVERLTRAIVNKLLHAPLTRLRAETGREEGIAMLEATRALFGLDSAAAPDDADAGRGPDREPDPEG